MTIKDALFLHRIQSIIQEKQIIKEITLKIEWINAKLFKRYELSIFDKLLVNMPINNKEILNSKLIITTILLNFFTKRVKFNFIGLKNTNISYIYIDIYTCKYIKTQNT